MELRRRNGTGTTEVEEVMGLEVRSNGTNGTM
ncbi:predicted protein [Sclerotinia sclerotiorum 1980 UF-70]|uniref:Uncharacterized protein n=1 Tax=Sclerotinia sclerotiorum (strain ATCC 18683 / 1980 / Ss-1) TaxID=665079 RepID=A7EHG7_SCLS1|nr:predicted protein [Sclerotinia sclerotiorum 1980 UF-70]EDO02283.1 predicted protein [Sclerotinia sclerotiorum 1980 UF-70]